MTFQKRKKTMNQRNPTSGEGRVRSALCPTKQSLSADQQRLVELLQQIRYGCIPCLRVRSGQPVLGPALRWTRTVKVLGANDPLPLAQAGDFVLRQKLAHFFRLLREIGDGEIHDLEVRDGLPLTFKVGE